MMQVAEDLAHTCWVIYNITATGNFAACPYCRRFIISNLSLQANKNACLLQVCPLMS